MEYTINRLAQLAGVSTRTLRFYDKIGLLAPKRNADNGYRVYGAGEVDRLQQILFFRELGMALDDIGKMLAVSDFDNVSALESHRVALVERRAQIDRLIANVEMSIQTQKGKAAMSDAAKFEGFKKQMVDENERKYGAEIREKYGEETVQKSNEAFMNMSAEQFAEMNALQERAHSTLKAALATGDPAGAQAQEAAALHGAWLNFVWGSYSPEAHAGVTQMYVEDERFKAYYEAIAPGAAEFLRDAVAIHVESKS